jgi:hypothetical protein
LYSFVFGVDGFLLWYTLNSLSPIRLLRFLGVWVFCLLTCMGDSTKSVSNGASVLCLTFVHSDVLGVGEYNRVRWNALLASNLVILNGPYVEFVR